MILAVSTEQVILIMFAGGPGLAALIVQVWKQRSEKPLRDASAAQTLTSTATGLLEPMQERIDHLEHDLDEQRQHFEAELERQRLHFEALLASANAEITTLQARLEVSEQHSLALAAEIERRTVAELELAILKGSGAGNPNPSDSPEASP